MRCPAARPALLIAFLVAALVLAACWSDDASRKTKAKATVTTTAPSAQTFHFTDDGSERVQFSLQTQGAET